MTTLKRLTSAPRPHGDACSPHALAASRATRQRTATPTTGMATAAARKEHTMKMSTPNLIRLAGLSALIAGTCYILVGALHPANVAASVTGTRWAVVHVLACATSFSVSWVSRAYTRVKRPGQAGSASSAWCC